MKESNQAHFKRCRSPAFWCGLVQMRWWDYGPDREAVRPWPGPLWGCDRFVSVALQSWSSTSPRAGVWYHGRRPQLTSAAQGLHDVSPGRVCIIRPGHPITLLCTPSGSSISGCDIQRCRVGLGWGWAVGFHQVNLQAAGGSRAAEADSGQKSCIRLSHSICSLKNSSSAVAHPKPIHNE